MKSLEPPSCQQWPAISTPFGGQSRSGGEFCKKLIWRGFIARKGLTLAQIAFWEQTFAKVIREEEWKKAMQENAWAEDFRGSAETRKHLDSENELLTKMLVGLGVVTR